MANVKYIHAMYFNKYQNVLGPHAQFTFNYMSQFICI